MALLDPDRLFPVEPRARALARTLHAEVRDLPIVSPHGHTDPRWYAEDAPFADPAQLFVVPDHYVFRMLCSQGVPLADLGVPRVDGGPTETDPREIWRRFAENYHLLRGTPSRLWLDYTFENVFGLDDPPLRRDRRPPLRHHRRAPRPARVPPARPLRALRHRGDRHDRERPRRPALAPDDPRLGLGRKGRHRLPPRRRRRPRLRGLRREPRHPRRAHRLRHRHLRRLPRRPPRPARLLHRARRHELRPRPPDRPHREPRAPPRPPPSSTASAPARRRPTRRTPSAARC